MEHPFLRKTVNSNKTETASNKTESVNLTRSERVTNKSSGTYKDDDEDELVILNP